MFKLQRPTWNEEAEEEELATMTMTMNGISINVDTTYTPIGISVLSLLLVLYIANRCQSLPVGIWHKFLKSYNDGKRLDLPP